MIENLVDFKVFNVFSDVKNLSLDQVKKKRRKSNTC